MGNSWTRLFGVAAVALLVMLGGCGEGPPQAAGLRFDVPDGFTVREGRAGQASVLIMLGDPGALVVAWTPAEEVPDAKAVIDAALSEWARRDEAYGILSLDTLEPREAAGRSADYLEMMLKPEGGSSANKFGRVLLFPGPQATYLVALISEADRSDDPEVVGTWERFVASLSWQES